MCYKHKFDALHDLVSLVQFKKRENTHGGVLLLVKLQAKAWNFTKVTLLHGCFSQFLNCTNSTKSRKASQIINKITKTRVQNFQNSAFLLRQTFIDNF